MKKFRKNPIVLQEKQLNLDPKNPVLFVRINNRTIHPENLSELGRLSDLSEPELTDLYCTNTHIITWAKIEMNLQRKNPQTCILQMYYTLSSMTLKYHDCYGMASIIVSIFQFILYYEMKGLIRLWNIWIFGIFVQVLKLDCEDSLLPWHLYSICLGVI